MSHNPRFTRRTLIKGSAAGMAAATYAGPIASRVLVAAQDPVPAEDQTLHYLWAAELRSQDPANALESGSLHIIRAAYEGLVAQVTGTTEIKPGLATEWTIAEDAQSVSFTIREGVQFHDGTTLDAEAVKKSYDRTIALNLGPATLLSDVEEVVVVDPLTVEIKLKSPNVFFMAYVPKIGIVSPTAWEGNQANGDFGAAYLEQNTAGTGPFRVTEIRPSERRVLERFEGYWQGWEGAHLSRIIFEIVPEAETRRQLLLDGSAHLIGLLPHDTVRAMEGEPGVQVNVSPNFEIDIMSLNTRKAPLDDIRVRKALQLAFDYEGYRDSILLGFGRVPSGPLAPEFTGANLDLPPFQQDLEQAKALLEEAGVIGQTLTANYVDTIAQEQAAVLILQDALAQLGVNLQVRGLPWNTMFEIAGDLELADHISVLLMSTFTADPVFTLNQNYGLEFVGKPYNWSFYENQAVQDLLDSAAQTLDEEERLSKLKEAQAIIVDEAPTVIYANPQAVEVVSTRVQNYIWNPVDYYWQVSWFDIWLSE